MSFRYIQNKHLGPQTVSLESFIRMYFIRTRYILTSHQHQAERQYMHESIMAPAPGINNQFVFDFKIET